MGLVILTYDPETILVCESHLRRGTFLPNLGMLSLWVLVLFARYAPSYDRSTDKSNGYCRLRYGWGHNEKTNKITMVTRNADNQHTHITIPNE